MATSPPPPNTSGSARSTAPTTSSRGSSSWPTRAATAPTSRSRRRCAPACGSRQHGAAPGADRRRLLATTGPSADTGVIGVGRESAGGVADGECRVPGSRPFSGSQTPSVLDVWKDDLELYSYVRTGTVAMIDAQTASASHQPSRLPYAIVAIDLALRAGARPPPLPRPPRRQQRHRHLVRPLGSDGRDASNEERRLFGADTWMLATVWMRPDRAARRPPSRGRSPRISSASTASAASSRRPASRSCRSDEQGSVLRRARRGQDWPAAPRHAAAPSVRRESAGPPEVAGHFSLLIKETHRAVDARHRPAAARLRGQAHARHAIRRSPRRPWPAPPSSTPISTGCPGATSSC